VFGADQGGCTRAAAGRQRDKRKTLIQQPLHGGAWHARRTGDRYGKARLENQTLCKCAIVFRLHDSAPHLVSRGNSLQAAAVFEATGITANM
jgi:hypothetical protein